MTNNEADCLVCGARYALDANRLDYCGACLAHERRHRSPAGCLPECRFCTPPVTGACLECGAGLTGGDVRCLERRPAELELLESGDGADAAEIGPAGADYDDACTAIVTREQARREIGRHDADTCCDAGHDHETAWQAFTCDVGDAPTYRGRAVLDWLGY